MDNSDHLPFVQYRFDRAEHPIEITKHGNSLKNKGPFKRTKASTIAMLKKGLDKHQPVKVLQKLKILREELLVRLHHVICLMIVANLKHSTKLSTTVVVLYY